MNISAIIVLILVMALIGVLLTAVLKLEMPLLYKQLMVLVLVAVVLCCLINYFSGGASLIRGPAIGRM